MLPRHERGEIHSTVLTQAEDAAVVTRPSARAPKASAGQDKAGEGHASARLGLIITCTVDNKPQKNDLAVK